MEARRSRGPVSRRALLGGSAALMIPAAMTSGCTSVQHAVPPKPGPEVALLTSAIVGEQQLVTLYATVLAAHPRLVQDLQPLHDHHTQHLAQLKRQYVPGTETESPTATPAATPAPADVGASLATLRTAERQAAAARVVDVTQATPGLAQLFADIGACEAVHVAILAGVS